MIWGAVVFVLVVGLLLGGIVFMDSRANRARKRRWDHIAWTDGRLREFIRFYQPLGFYDAEKSVEELMNELQSEAYDIRGMLEEGEEQVFRRDLLLLAKTAFRILWWDLESDVADGNEVYASYLQSLAEISRGQFTPSAIHESWDAKEGPIRVTFTIEETRKEVNPKVDNDWLDLGILEQINELLPDPQYRFEAVEQDDQTAQVLMLTQEEKATLEGRGWRFQ